MDIRSAKLIQRVLEEGSIHYWIGKIKIDSSNAKGLLFHRMTITVKPTHLHLLSHIENMAYTLIACCQSEYLEHKIEKRTLHLW